MRSRHLILLLFTSVVTPLGAGAAETPPLVREILVPLEDLNALLGEGTQRVMLPRKEYDVLLEKAKRAPDAKSPVPAAIVAAQYAATIENQRARIEGKLTVEVFSDGLHALPLEIGGMGLRRAVLDGRPAPVGSKEGGPWTLFVEGQGVHALALDLIAPVETTAARQVLQFRLPRPAAARLTLTVPGDVEVKGGADVSSRTVDAQAQVTRFELLPPRGDATLVMSLNSRLHRQERVVVARSVQAVEVTQAYERLHVTMALEILHRAVDTFRFAVPEGFDVTEVASPRLARWAVTAEGNRKILEVRTREASTDPVTMSVAAVRTQPRFDAWTWPRLEPLDVVGQASVIGLLVEDRLRAESIAAEKLIPIDTPQLLRVLPASVVRAEPGAPTLVPVAAYYAPQGEYKVSARFVKPEARCWITSHALLSVEDRGLEVRGGFALVPEAERLFAFDFTLPAEWQITAVTGEDGKPLQHESHAAAKGVRIRVTLPTGAVVGQPVRINYRAERTSLGWTATWQKQEIEFPQIVALTPGIVQGAIAVAAGDDLVVRPKTLESLTPLDDSAKQQYGLRGMAAGLAYRCETPAYRASLVAERIAPRLTARTYSFFRLEPDALNVRYELLYQVENARTRQLKLLVPASTPASISIQGLGPVRIKEFSSTDAGDGMRRWTVLLEDALRGTVGLAVDFQQAAPERQAAGRPAAELTLPIVRADDVAYQSGHAAVEGAADVEVTVTPQAARRVDVGELADAEYQPGRRLLGAFGFVAEGNQVKAGLRASMKRHPGYPVPAALVERAELYSVLSAEGLSITTARFELRTKALLLGVELPGDSTLWSVVLDGKPLTPQNQNGRVLVALPSTGNVACRLAISYETPIAAIPRRGALVLPAPTLFLHGRDQKSAEPIPLADLQWNVQLPSGYELVRSNGTVVTGPPRRPKLAIVTSAKALTVTCCCLLPAISMQSPREAASRSKSAALPSPNYMTTAEPAAEKKADFKKKAEEPAKTPARVEATVGLTAPGVLSADLVLPLKAKKGEALSKSLAGFRSLQIDAHQQPDDWGRIVTFQSLGVEPRLEITLSKGSNVDLICWALGIAVLLAGLMRTGDSAWCKFRCVLVLVVLGTVVPMPLASPEAVHVGNAVVFGAVALAVYYLILAAARRLCRMATSLFGTFRKTSPVAAAVLVALLASAGVQAEPPAAPYVVQIVEPLKPVKIPENALLIPFDPKSPFAADKVLVAYEKYVELWNRAYPDKRIEAQKPPVDYALSGATYRATLVGDEYLQVSGTVDLEVFTEQYVTVPFALSGGVISRAELDGKPARLDTARTAPAAAKTKPEPQPDVVVLYVSGKGRHQLAIDVRLRVQRQGGWRVAEGLLPAAPAASLAITVPQAQTEVRLSQMPDRPNIDTQQAGETIETALGARGAVGLRWRPKVAEGQIDSSLTVRSRSTFDVQEDGLVLTCRLDMEFRRTQREFFKFDAPADYLVEKVEGNNVRGWEVQKQEGRQTVEVTLLKAARDTESLQVILSRRMAEGKGWGEFDVPTVAAQGAALQAGQVTVRRSPALDLQMVRSAGVSRVDIPAEAAKAAGAPEVQRSPLGLRPYQAYEFATLPYTVRLTAAALGVRTRAQVKTVLRMGQYERELESRATITAAERPLYLIELFVPDDLDLRHVSTDGDLHWALTTVDKRRLLSVYLLEGRTGDVHLLLRGRLGDRGPAAEVKLPRLEVRGAAQQDGFIAVQADPDFNVEAVGLANCRTVLLSEVGAWVNPSHVQTARLTLAYSRPDYSGTLRLVGRNPDVRCTTVSNVRVTSRAVEETILLEFNIQNAGIREIRFSLPPGREEPRIRVPMLREKQVWRQGDKPDAPWLVRLQLQDERLGQLRVLVENDRALVGRSYQAPIPRVETGRVERQFVALEGSGRDELSIERVRGLDVLERQQRIWAQLQSYLPGNITHAYLVSPGSADPELVFATSDRQTVETAGARILLAETRLALDAHGAYRAVVSFRVDNTTEQFLEVDLPADADLWTAHVAGEPVKPIRDTKSGNAQRVRVPLVKTAQGDPDYPVVLKYGGAMAMPSGWSALDFPLVRTVNIKVARSLLELHLPETHRWLNFGEKMSFVADSLDYSRTQAQVDLEQTGRLLETVRHGKEYSKVRASSSLGFLERALLSSGRSGSRGEVVPEVQRQQELFKQAREELARQAPQEQRAALDNRKLLNDSYGGQKNEAARNVVQNLGDNWDVSAPVPTAKPKAGPSDFNPAWFEANQLGEARKESALHQESERAKAGEKQLRNRAIQLQQRAANVDKAQIQWGAQQMEPQKPADGKDLSLVENS